MSISQVLSLLYSEFCKQSSIADLVGRRAPDASASGDNWSISTVANFRQSEKVRVPFVPSGTFRRSGCDENLRDF